MDNSEAVVLQGIRKRYGDVTAVAGVDLSVPAGQITALLGPNGAGKSTTVDILLGLRSPDAGQVRVYQRSPRQALDEGLIGAVLQDGKLPTGTRVGELLRAIAALHRQPLPVDQAARRAGVADILARRTDRLSGGQAQRVRFALALLGDPALLVLDEPTAGLDVQARRDFWRSVREYGGTVLFSTHYLEEADEMADRIVVLDRGRVVADGSAAAIRAAAGARQVRCTLPDVADDVLAALPGVSTVERHGAVVLLRCADSDALVRALLVSYPEAADIEVAAAPLSEAFLTLTGGAK